MIMSLAIVFAPFCDVKNFEDMRKVVHQLYQNDSDSLSEPHNEGTTGFGDMLTIGDFDSVTDEDAEYYLQNTRKEYTTLDDAMQDMDGMF